MFNESYKTETLEQHGVTYRVEWVHDYDHGAPWENEDGHGPVSDWERRWCNDEWHYCGIIVTVLNEDEEETDISSSLWGIEDGGYCSRGYHATVIQDLIGECEYQSNRAIYPVTHCGV